MSNHQDPLLVALKEGKTYTWTVPDGGDLASMRKAIKHGQTLTMSPVVNPGEVQVGNIVLVKWHKGDLFHMVGEIQGNQFLIVNSLGKASGWVNGEDILGRITSVIEPEPSPGVPVMLEQLNEAFSAIIQQDNPSEGDRQRLSMIISDLCWYAERIGMEQWDEMPRSNKWSFEQNLWHLTKQVVKKEALIPNRLHFMIDSGKRCVGLAAEIFALFEGVDLD